MEYELNFRIAQLPDNFVNMIISSEKWKEGWFVACLMPLMNKIFLHINKYDMVEYVIAINNSRKTSAYAFGCLCGDNQFYYEPIRKTKVAWYISPRILQYYWDNDHGNHYYITTKISNEQLANLIANNKITFTEMCCWCKMDVLRDPKVSAVMQKLKITHYQKIILELEDETILAMLKNGNPSKNVLRRYINAAAKQNRDTLAGNLRCILKS